MEAQEKIRSFQEVMDLQKLMEEAQGRFAETDIKLE